jgi:hypothetical protein
MYSLSGYFAPVGKNHQYQLARRQGVHRNWSQYCEERIALVIAGNLVNHPVCSQWLHRLGARSSIVVRALCYKPEGPGDYSASNRNEYQKHKNNYFF